MAELEWKKDASRAQAAALLRRVADGLEGDGAVELEEGGWELKLKAAERIELELELEVDEGDTELEIELKWSRSAAADDYASAEAEAL